MRRGFPYGPAAIPVQQRGLYHGCLCGAAGRVLRRMQVQKVTWANNWNGVGHRYEPPEYDERTDRKPLPTPQPNPIFQQPKSVIVEPFTQRHPELVYE